MIFTGHHQGLKHLGLTDLVIATGKAANVLI